MFSRLNLTMKIGFLTFTMLGMSAGLYLAKAADPKPNLDKVDKATQKHSIRASKIIGMEVRNEKGEKLGKVSDLVLDTGSSTVRYAALSFGGVLGLGDKLFAIPWTALDCRQGKERNDYYLVLSVDPQVLKNSTGFDQNNWPDFGSPEFTQQIDRTFNIHINRNR